MFIEEIILDGFKSYSKRTTVGPLDPTFNAITGLNGSGKSNVLDSICFVLGITNLKQVRVNDLQELVYKHGQAGVTKASVTIVFNNEDPETSPVGYESSKRITVTRQIAIGGRSKYLINGINAQNNRVQNLFLSVQLNVNNPHFLIMQGRITKVINMKPPEILGMIEEAAGTSMFEKKKIQTLGILEKKSKKVEEIVRVLNEDITPNLNRLKEESSSYMQYTASVDEQEKLFRFITAYDYSEANEMVQNQSNGIEDIKNQKEQRVKEKEEIALNNENLKKQLKKMERSDKDNDMSEMESKNEKWSNDMVKHQTNLKNKRNEIEKERASISGLAQSKQEIVTSIAKKKKERDSLSAKIKDIVGENEQLAEKLKTSQKKLNDFNAGIIADGDTENGSFTEQLMEAKRVAVEAASEYKQAEIRIKHLSGELQQKKKMKQDTIDHAKMQEEYNAVAKDVEKLKKELESVAFNAEKLEELQTRKRDTEPKVFQLSEKVGIMAAQMSGMEFSYSDPSRDFDRSKVRGVVANLITLRDADTATALEICAGGKLYNIIVEDEQTGKALLAKGELKRRVTFLPLNKIDKRTIESEKVNRAKSLVGKDNVKPAIDWIQYDKSLTNAMNFVFGTTFIAKDKKQAHDVAFDPAVRVKTISLDGDEYNPAGTLTGGSKSQSGSVLSHIQKLNEMNGQLSGLRGELEKVNYELAKLQTGADKHRSLSQILQLKEHELSLINSRLNLNPHHQLVESIKEIEKKIEDDTLLLKQSKQRESDSLKKQAELEKQKNNFQSIRDQQLKAIEKTLADTKESFNRSNKIVKNEQQVIEKTTLEIEELELELKVLSEQTSGNESTVAAMEKELAALEQDAEKLKDNLDNLRQSLATKREEIKRQSEKYNQLTNEIDQNQRRSGEIDLELKKLEHKLERSQKDGKDAEKRIIDMNNRYKWIKSEKHMFGKPNTEYDFNSTSIKSAKNRYNQLQSELEKLSKNVNKKVISMYEKVQQEYADLVAKKNIVEKDKEKIEKVIFELDEKKNESLKTTWKSVNRDFGEIFSTLLPGTKAKLHPIEGDGKLDGLEVKVAFGDVWKETLSELSGGQKSLLALSLVLALLKFKPAPFYILDEIDAALDLSHTHNIGTILKTRFSTSQFIVVSLKEGMFNNANVLFQTNFKDGVSEETEKVASINNNHYQQHIADDDEDEYEEVEYEVEYVEEEVEEEIEVDEHGNQIITQTVVHSNNNNNNNNSNVNGKSNGHTQQVDDDGEEYEEVEEEVDVEDDDEDDGEEAEEYIEGGQEEDIEPILNYTRFGNGVTEILKKDAASCMAVHPKFIVLGTHWGSVSIHDFEGNKIERFDSHSATITEIAIDPSGDYIASCSEDGKVIINPFDRSGETMTFSYVRPITAIALDPEFAHKNTRQFVTGGKGGQLILNSKGWFRSKETVIHQGEGPIYAIKWCGNFIAWANEHGVKIYDCSTNMRIAHIPRKEGSPRGELFRCCLCWERPDTLIIGWAKSVEVIQIIERVEASGAAAKIAQITNQFSTKYWISGIAPFGEDLVILGYKDGAIEGHSEPSATAATPKMSSPNNATGAWNQGRVDQAEKPSIYIVSRKTNQAITTDHLNVNGFEHYKATDYRLDYNTAESIFYIVCPKDVVTAKPRNLEDHLKWLMDKNRYDEALEEVEKDMKTIKSLPPAKIKEIGEKDEAINLLVANTDKIPIKTVVNQLGHKPEYIHHYLHTLFTKDSRIGMDFHEMQVALYAQYDPKLLLPFLKNSISYNLDKAFQVCKEKNLYEEMVYILGRMGSAKEALNLILDKLGRIKDAVEFVEQQKDNDLWDYFINKSITNPRYVSELLENIGSNVDPIKLIRLIPDRMEIHNLRNRLVKILSDYNLQMSLREGCKEILKSDCVYLSETHLQALKAGHSLEEDAKCATCNQSIVTIKPDCAIVLYFCNHAYHNRCLKTSEQAANTQQTNQSNQSKQPAYDQLEFGFCPICQSNANKVSKGSRKIG
ncbi:structural maintenance of chromosome protein [Heterostelium album PN500]|uniref:Structural maintenance of chromosome protein n=1 Tax=Heterostelium pallidum (strain ATCC 26659 / Pp 5 / PN500) TaxID=670386 RepID=D3BQ59_HETP5|nr:structural maintenance of chromosome protein [Heterostelium album PN500]EFA76279.1 structural maintenance of chromosome protein [Heterostelium album PN500]|eukprot:XP_020428411.1 structural maintenance of chromosome protein [Heterostelium album PN500]